MKESLNVLVISPHYHTFVKGLVDTTAKYVSNITVLVHHNYLSEFAYYLPFSYFRHVEKFSKEKLVDLKGKPENVKVNIVSTLYFIPDSRNKKLGNKLFEEFNNFIRRNNLEFDLIHAHFAWPCGYAGVKLAKEYEVPIVVTAHGFDVYDLPFRNEFWFNRVRYVLNNANYIITVGKNMKDIIVGKLGIGNDKVSVVPNGFDSRLFFPMDKIKVRQSLNLPLNRKIVLNVANLVPVKGHGYLIEAMRKIVDQRKDILCVIVGDGMLKKDLENQIKKLNLENYVKLVGAKPHDEIPLWMNASDLFVLPSLSESFGVVQIEAMACGVPVVATRNGGSEEIITSEDYGLLCEPANPENLAEKILIALEKEWDREKIRKYAEQFSWENVAHKLIKIYSEVVLK